MAACAAGCAASANSTAECPPTAHCVPGQPVPQDLELGVELIPPATSPFVRQELPAVRFDDTGSASLTLTPGVMVHGQILDEQGKAPVQAQVIFSRASGIAGLPKLVTQVPTDAGGTFAVLLPPLAYEMRVLPVGDLEAVYPPLTTLLSPTNAGEFPAPVVVRMQRGIQLDGRVTSALAVGIASVPVRAVDGDHNDQILSTTAVTNTDGGFTLWLSQAPDARSVAHVRVIASLSNALTLSREINGSTLGVNAARVELHGPALPDLQTFVVKVVGKSQAGTPDPLQGARVDATTVVSLPTADTLATFAASTNTYDGAGHAALQLIPAGDGNRSYTVTVTPPEGLPYGNASFTLQVGPTGGVLSTLALDPRPSVLGTLTGPDGALLRGVLVTGTQLDPPDGATPTMARSTSGLDGSFILHVDNGRYDFDVVPPLTASLARLSLADRDVSGTLELGNIQLPTPLGATVALAGRDGKPVLGIEVRLYATGYRSCPSAEPPGCPVARLRADGTTGSDGQASVLLSPN